MHRENFWVETFAFGESDDFGAVFQIGIFVELAANDSVGLAGVVRVGVDEMEQNRGAVDMAEKIVAETFAFGGTLDEARDIGDENVFFVDGGDTEIGDDGGEGVVGDFRFGVRDDREEGGFASVGETD